MGTSHIAGASEEMRPFDDLSRERLPEGFDELKFVETSNDVRLSRLFATCSPILDGDMSRPSGVFHFSIMQKVVRLVKECIEN